MISEFKCKVKCVDSELNNIFLGEIKYLKEFKNIELLIIKFIYFTFNVVSKLDDFRRIRYCKFWGFRKICKLLVRG